MERRSWNPAIEVEKCDDCCREDIKNSSLKFPQSNRDTALAIKLISVELARLACLPVPRANVKAAIKSIH